MHKQSVNENEFFPAVGGAGSINGQPGYGTFGSPDVSQDPSHFENSNNNKAVNQNSNTRKDTPDSASMASDVATLYSRKVTPSPDEVVAGIKYEMGQQIKKDKQKAKENVLTNLKKDPHYYSSLKMLGIDDESMVNDMEEQKQHPNDAPLKEKVTVNIDATKQIFEDMANAKGKKYVVNSGICDVMKDMWAQKQQRSAWKKS